MVYLVGAGPGHPELLTLRGRRLLSRADVVLYDALVHRSLLTHCKPGARLRFVGKRAGTPSERQSRIHDHMVQAARAGKSVVRLKGGDPLLFARGSEEAQALHAAGIPFEVVPGVSSPSAVAAYAGIPMTDRHLSSSVAYVTATESPEKDQSSHDWPKLATGTETLVIFMGLRKLDSLMGRLIAHGRPANTPAAVVQWASLAKQRVVRGTVGTLAALAQEADLGMPSLTVVGDVCKLHGVLDWHGRLPLAGKRIAVTREDLAPGVASRLWDLGAEPCHIPAIRSQADPGWDKTAVPFLSQLGSYDWLLWTSARAVRFFFDALGRQGLDARALHGVRVATVGKQTAQAARDFGILTDLVPSVQHGTALGAALVDHLTQAQPRETGVAPGLRALIPQSAQAHPALAQVLCGSGLFKTVDTWPLYQTHGDVNVEALESHLSDGPFDGLTFASPSAVHSLWSACPEPLRHTLFSCPLFSVGPRTSEAVRSLGLKVAREATPHSMDGVVNAVLRHFQDPA